MRISVLSVGLLLITALSAYSQGEKTLMTIGGQNVSVQEFERIYNKNNVAGTYEKQPVNEYLDLFINFKLKVIEAENLGMDTTSSFLNELKGYRDQLAKPYLSDSATTEDFMKQEYERMKTELHVSHILIRLDPKASPADTLAAYNKIMDIRNRILKGESFEKMAREYSEDPTAPRSGGDIGWTTAFRTVMEFENGMYSTPIGQVSMPVRTQFGYHLIKVTEKRPSQGKVLVAHIFVRAPEDMNPDLKKKAEAKINAIYDSLQNGVSFEQLVINNSEDRSTAENGGKLPWFGSGQMIQEFEKAAFSLNNKGDYSKPVQSFYGWHIVKLIDKKDLGSYEQARPEILSKVRDASILNVKKQIFLDKLKKDYNYTFNKPGFEKFSSLVDTSIFSGNWNDSVFLLDKTTLFSVGDKNLSVADFAAYLKKKERKMDRYSIPVFLNEQYQMFSENEIMDYARSLLPSKYPEFKYILQEYHDGILLFDLTDKMVWSKAVQDTVGLENYYNENKSNYVWGKRAEVLIFSSDSTELVNAAKALVNKYGKKKKFNKDFVLLKLCPGDSLKNCIDIVEARFEKGDNEEVDKTNWVYGAGENYDNKGKTSFVFVRKTLEPTTKKLSEARGLVTADYQNFLEKAWIAELRKKYPVTVDYDLLKTIK